MSHPTVSSSEEEEEEEDEDLSSEEEAEEEDLSSSRLVRPRRRRRRRRGKTLSSKSSSDDFARLLRLARPEWKWIAFGLVSLLVRLPFSVAMPHFIAGAIGAVVENDDSKKFRANVERFLFAGTVNGLLDFWNVFFFSYARARIIKRLREDVFRAILKKNIEWFDERTTGRVTSMLSSDCGEIANDLSWVFRNCVEASSEWQGYRRI